jgi:hypothetical protein
MKKWKDISLYTFQQIERVNADDTIIDEDKALFSVCEVFGITEYELSNVPQKKAMAMLSDVEALFKSAPVGKPVNRSGKFVLNYDASGITFGQYIELSFFLQQEIHGAHLALASIARRRFHKYVTDGHRERAEHFLHQPVEMVLGSLNLFIGQFKMFNDEYKDLFGLDKEAYDIDVQSDRFNKRYGWIYSASRIAEYERITLDEAFRLPIRQALNGLMYLKEKDKYEAEQQKKLLKKN